MGFKAFHSAQATIAGIETALWWIVNKIWKKNLNRLWDQLSYKYTYNVKQTDLNRNNNFNYENVTGPLDHPTSLFTGPIENLLASDFGLWVNFTNCHHTDCTNRAYKRYFARLWGPRAETSLKIETICTMRKRGQFSLWHCGMNKRVNTCNFLYQLYHGKSCSLLFHTNCVMGKNILGVIGEYVIIFYWYILNLELSLYYINIILGLYTPYLNQDLSVYTFVHPTVPQTELSTFSHRTDSTK
jgi:hypothetical protein